MHSACSTYYQVTPRPITDRQYWTAIGDDPRNADFIAWLDEIAQSTPPEFPATSAADFLAARRHNDRALLDRHWQSHRLAFSALAIRRCLRGCEEPDSDDRLLNWLWGFLTEPTWVVSAHLPDNDLPARDKPTLDLAACEMAALLAELREVLLPWLEAISPNLAARIIHEVDARVLGPYGAGELVGWQNPANPWNNWTGVCAGSILAACESLMAQGFPRFAARARALDGLNLYLENCFTPHGECDEGMNYWIYGMSFACLGWSRLPQQEFDARVNQARFRQVADYPRRAHLFAEYFYSGNDGSLHQDAPLNLLPWLSAASGNQWLRDWAQRSRFDSRAPGFLRHFGQTLRLISNPPAQTFNSPITKSESFQILPDQQVVVMRQETSDGELLVSLSGGSNQERHNHNDLGHFLVACNQQWIVPDMGWPFYVRDFFGPNRYRYLPASSRGHNCPLIGGIEQYTGGAEATVLQSAPEAPNPIYALDLTSAYPPEAKLEKWTRTLQKHQTAMALTDAFQVSRDDRETTSGITHVIWSLEMPNESPAPNASLTLKLGPLRCEIAPAPLEWHVQEYSANELNLKEWRDRSLYCIRMDFATDETGSLEITTTFDLQA